MLASNNLIVLSIWFSESAIAAIIINIRIMCYNRTNVVQSMLARISLRHQLQQMDVLSELERVEDHATFESTFKNGL